MSIRTRETTSIIQDSISISTDQTIPWVRNPSWLSLPAVTNTDQKLVGLYLISPDSTFAAFTVSGNYTVNWGDGVSENVSAGVTAYHQYDYNDADLVDTNAPVTFQDSGDTVTRTSHGYKNDMPISFASITSTTGINVAQTYYVVNATTNTFQLAADMGGAPLALTTDGSGYILPYKQAIITITPQGGANLTSINLNVKHNQASLQQYATGWLDVVISGPNLTTLTISGSTITAGHRNLEQIQLISTNSIATMTYAFNTCVALRSIPTWVTSTSLTNTSFMFSSCYSLETAPLFNTQNVTDMSSMFNACYSLISVPAYDTRSATLMPSMFANCYALKNMPLLNTALVTDMSAMFVNCVKLTIAPYFNTASATTMAQMFSGCNNLLRIPAYNTSKVTSMSSMLNACYQLRTIPQINTGNVTNMGTMFGNCRSLRSIPTINTASVTDMSSTFNSCYSLDTIPLLNTSAVTNAASMFLSCNNLKAIPLLNLSFCKNFASMFNGTNSLTYIPAINVSNATSSASFSTMINTCTNLSQIDASSFYFTFSVASCKLSNTALNTIYTNLPTTTGQTITVTNNWGTASDDPTIATAKGWTVTG